MAFWNKSEEKEDKKATSTRTDDQSNNSGGVSLLQQQNKDHRARFATSARTDVFLKTKGMGSVVFTEYSRAVKMDNKDNWRVLNIGVFDIDGQDDKTIDVKVLHDNVSFHKAMTHLADMEVLAKAQELETVDVKKGEFPVDFFETEHFLDVSEREQLVFEQSGRPHLKLWGQIVTKGKYLMSEVDRAEEKNGKSVAANQTLEDGVIKDTFNGVSACGNLEDMLNKYEALNEMNSFIDCVRNSLDALNEGLYDKLLSSVDVAENKLGSLKELGVYTEPFAKFLAQCNIAGHLYYAQQGLSDMQNSGKYLKENIERIRESVGEAENKFRQHGATDDEVDLLRAAVMTGNTPKIPEFIQGFITRYDKRKGEFEAKMKTDSNKVNMAILPAEKKLAAPKK